VKSKILSMMALPLAGGCQGIQSALDPRGPEAAAIAQSTWIMSAASALILALVMALALYAIFRNPAKRRAPSSTTVIVAGGLVLPIVALSALLVYGVAITREMRAPGPDALELEIIAHRWWWEVRYPGPDGTQVATANELRLPVGRPVSIALRSDDVIHSFWVPVLAGKLDAIPGRVNRMSLRADSAGEFRGQCAEFCGAQHARMALHVVAEPPAAFERWLGAQRAPARVAAGAASTAGGEALFRAHCAECHVVRGIVASGGTIPAPDLTHVASRAWLGAGTLRNTPENLSAWIARNDAIKPGNAMPSFGQRLDPAHLEALAAWLARLE
jgi:cytochrome c oxidase subunit II